MNNKGLSETNINIETPNDFGISEKPLNSEKIKSSRVDINILKSKLQEDEKKEFKKNAYILSALVIALGILGFYLSL